MAKKVVIVESPTKAKAISKYLGKGYSVKASMGHVRDLPQKEFGVDVKDGFRPTYHILPRSRKVIGSLRKAIADADAVYLAPDPDREGEAIAWHLQHALKLPDEAVRRVTFNEITREAVRNAFGNPGRIDMNLVDAQQARRILDRIVGYELSPLISQKIVRGLSAGRVQSVALRLITEREQEIQAFVPQEYWQIKAILRKDEGASFEAQLEKLDGKAAKLSTEKQASQLCSELEAEAYRVRAIKKRESVSKAPPPFTTSTMQQAAASRLGFSTSHTMRTAQELYEGIDIGEETVGLITYMRTDSTRVSQPALNAVRTFIGEQFGGKYVPQKPNAFKSPRGAQAAHEAIRPTDVKRTPEMVKGYLTPAQHKLYDFIWRRFVASQMTPARYSVTEVKISAGRALFVARARELLFDGYTRLLPPRRDSDERALPPLAEGDALTLEQIIPSQHFTEPPRRYTEGTLVRELEKRGIGRPSTYAPIINTLKKRNYVRAQKGTLHPTDLGMAVTEKLVKHFPREMDVAFTSELEEKLDRVEEGAQDWRSMLKGFYERFEKDLEQAKKQMRPVGEDDPELSATCEKCGSKMVVKFDRRSGRKFLGCSAFPRCKHTVDLSSEREGDGKVTEHSCPRCGAPMLLKTGRRGRQYLACSAFPKCRTLMGLDADGQPVPMEQRLYTGLGCPRCGGRTYVAQADEGGEEGLPGAAQLRCDRCGRAVPLVSVNEAIEQTELLKGNQPPECPRCGKPMELKWSKKGMFWGCAGYPECKETAAISEADLPQAVPTYEKCERCGRPLLLRWGRYGRFLACSGFPRCRNMWRLSLDSQGASVVPCPREGCEGSLIKKVTPEGREVYGCTRYPYCNYTCEVLPDRKTVRGSKAHSKSS